jgi:hypothetical protein
MARGLDQSSLVRPRARFDARRLLSAALLLGAGGCPAQELAPLVPCTVSTVSLDAAQSGTDQVDLLFMIDNSASMSEEQQKLNAQLPRLVQVLTSGDFDGVPNANGELDFRPVGSLRLGVVSSDLGANGVPGVWSCGSNSFQPIDQAPAFDSPGTIDRPFGDDGLLQNSTAVAITGVTIRNPPATGNPVQAVPPRPECQAASLPRFLEYPMGGSAADIAGWFSCIAELGVNGCAIEQQLEATWKALAPSTDRSFSRGTGGHGLPTGMNAGFLRPEAILALILVTDEEDCSSPDASAAQLYSSLDVTTINNVCGSNTNLLHPVERYIAGFRGLKSEAFQDLVIFGGIVGVPLARDTQGQSLAEILARPDMRFSGGLLGARPACTAGGGAGTATPARRIVEVAMGFGDNGVITSICEDNYSAALDAIIGKIAGKLSGQCLPRRLQRNAEGIVECRVVEIKGPGDNTPCDMSRGRIRQLKSREVNGTSRVTCEIAQLPVRGNQEPPGVGWYYDDFSAEVASCQGSGQRIAFTGNASVEDGKAARFECFQSVAEPRRPANAKGFEAIGASCTVTGGPRGRDSCSTFNEPGIRLACVAGSCLVACTGDAECPPAHVCTATGTPGFCVNPTCPQETQGT